MIFTEKYWLIGLLLIPLIVFVLYTTNQKTAIKFKFIEDIKQVFKYGRFLFWGNLTLLGGILTLFTLILANPQKINTTESINKNGIDIVFVLDVSKSMESEDLKPSRLEAAKNILNKFLTKLKNDRVGLVIFAGKSFVSLPLTFDYNIVKQTIQNISTDTINQDINGLDGTDIGDALLMASNLFKDQKRQKVIILLTDGDANRGINPQIAAKYLANKKIKVYTIGIGSPYGGYITYNVGPFSQRVKIPPLNGQALQQIAQITNGQYFRATSNNVLEQIFNTLGKVTKTNLKIKQQILYKPIYLPFAYILCALLVLYGILRLKNKLI